MYWKEIVKGVKSKDNYFYQHCSARNLTDLPGWYNDSEIIIWELDVVIKYPETEEKAEELMNVLVEFIHEQKGVMEGCYIKKPGKQKQEKE